MAFDTADRTRLVPPELDTRLYAFAYQAFTAQGRANVALAQADLTALSDPTGILARAASLQTHMRKMAGFYQQATVPQMLAVFTDLDGASNLASALSRSIGDAKGAAKLCRAVAGDIDQRAQILETTAQRAGDTVGMTADAVAAFDAELDRVTAAMDGEDGAIARVSEAIDRMQASIDTDIDDIANSSREIGDGIKKLVTFALTLVTSDSGKDKKKDAPAADRKTASSKAGSDDDADADTKTKAKAATDAPAKDPFGDLEPFPVESIGAIGEGVGRSVAVMKALQDDNRKLADLLHQKAELSAALTACQVVRMQGQSFGTTLTAMIAAMRSLGETYAELAKRYAGIADAFDATSDDTPDYLVLVQSIKAADRDWGTIRRDLSDIERAFAGIHAMFPPVA